MAVTQYIGARYVPMFADPAEWDNSNAYEPLTIVTYQGNSYTSRQAVPVGIDINDESFWVCSGNYNAQVEAYRKEVLSVLPYDTTPTKDSTKGVTSDGIYDAIENVSATAKAASNAVTAITPFDTTPTKDSTKGVTSSGVLEEIIEHGGALLTNYGDLSTSAGFTAALNAADAADISSVVIPSGTYYLDSTFTPTHLSSIIGLNATIVANSPMNYMFDVTSIQSASDYMWRKLIYGINFDGNNNAQTAIYYTHWHLWIKCCTVTRVTTTAIIAGKGAMIDSCFLQNQFDKTTTETYPTYQNCVGLELGSDCSVTNCKIWGYLYAIKGTFSYSVFSNIIFFSQYNPNGSCAFYGTGTVNNANVSTCEFDGMTRIVYCDTPMGINIENSVFLWSSGDFDKNTSKHVILADTVTAITGKVNVCRQVTIQNCTFNPNAAGLTYDAVIKQSVFLNIIDCVLQNYSTSATINFNVGGQGYSMAANTWYPFMKIYGPINHSISNVWSGTGLTAFTPNYSAFNSTSGGLGNMINIVPDNIYLGTSNSWFTNAKLIVDNASTNEYTLWVMTNRANASNRLPTSLSNGKFNDDNYVISAYIMNPDASSGVTELTGTEATTTAYLRNTLFTKITES